MRSKFIEQDPEPEVVRQQALGRVYAFLLQLARQERLAERTDATGQGKPAEDVES